METTKSRIHPVAIGLDDACALTDEKRPDANICVCILTPGVLVMQSPGLKGAGSAKRKG